MATPHLSWLFLIVFIFCMNMHAVSGLCLSDQQSLLLQMKDNLIFNAAKSTILVKWNQSSDCCTWEGITCDAGRITGLKLSEESISGGINDNSSLFNLIHLKSLDLSFNNIGSTIPTRMGNLTNLSYLNLSNAGFMGQIPKEISLLIKLVALDLSSYFFLNSNASLKVDQSRSLRMLVQNLTKLEELYLDGVTISATGKDWGHALSSSLLNLRVLSMFECGLSGPIDQSLAKLQSLSMIRLNGNNLSTPVPQFFAYYSNLTSLELRSCGLYGTFPKKIFQVPTLQTLDISHNELLEGVLPEFPKNIALQLLQLSQTNFSGRLPISISNLQKLSSLDLSHCQFIGTLPNTLVELAHLVYLDLSVNNFTGSIPPSGWEGLVHLANFHLSHNFLSGSIPSSLFALPSVQKIELSNNKFSGQVLEFPNAPFSMLDTLDLSSNVLHGPIPMSIFKLKKLSTLSLSFNNFNGTIQLSMIQGLRNLVSLDLSYNSLSVDSSNFGSNFTSLPQILIIKLASCKLRVFPNLKTQLNLDTLDLSNNHIFGEIPNWISEVGNGSLLHLNLSHNHLTGIQEPFCLPNLAVLDLHFNQIQRKIPSLPPYASYIDLSNNNFTSFIPADIGKNLSTVSFFSISNNGLIGAIPESICSAHYLQVLDLSENSLSGNIPACVPNMSQTLGILNLQRNNLGGQIPDTFPLNCNLRTLDLNENVLTNRTPQSLASCRALEVFDLGNNEMLDTFPLFLKNFSTLRVLVLRSNKFYGHITCEKSIGAWLVIQIVDVASNNFSGEVPGQCLMKWNAMISSKDYDRSELNLLRFAFFQFDPFLYYENAVTVTNKGHKMELVKILSVFTSIDFSSNNFLGEIPKELGKLKCLHVLNLSNNALSHQIPSSFGNLHQLESLDLSRNHLKGAIPTSLSNLNFLSFLDLSHNQLVGRIPSGIQIQTFLASSFEGNDGLCGPPLTPNCTDDGAKMLPESHSKSSTRIEWDLIAAEIGFIVGFGIVVGPLMFSRKWRKRYFDSLEDITFRIYLKYF
ncbi:hypothetical protein FNV43_RR08808 [Rhamnella rubrinervis]|uniref:Verticillium wilt resistance-like protein n=1 Tax=Rhamnella rubrinervis TaxID=2594499 RepID=A0A8K0H9L3_9ROSA|nr:hypothetical protein FNV43_RR08808 [Rhamnella rubrinervis]